MYNYKYRMSIPNDNTLESAFCQASHPRSTINLHDRGVTYGWCRGWGLCKESQWTEKETAVLPKRRCREGNSERQTETGTLSPSSRAMLVASPEGPPGQAGRREVQRRCHSVQMRLVETAAVLLCVANRLSITLRCYVWKRSTAKRKNSPRVFRKIGKIIKDTKVTGWQEKQKKKRWLQRKADTSVK